jgi:peptidoglycan/LPS O-acetylase OafA/YrhL
LAWATENGITDAYYFITKVGVILLSLWQQDALILLFIMKVGPDFMTQVLWNAPFAVDTFFYLSGFLAAYLTLCALDSKKFSLLQYYLHRYIRLTPVLLFWWLFNWQILPLLATV